MEYTCIAAGTLVLTDYDDHTDNTKTKHKKTRSQSVAKILSLIKNTPNKSAAGTRGHMPDTNSAFLTGASGVVFLAITTAQPNVSVRVCFSFLEAVQRKFETMMMAGVDPSTFRPELTSLFQHHNTPGNDKLSAIRSDLEDTRVFLAEGIEHLVLRGQTIDGLVNASTEIDIQAKEFKGASKDLKHRMCWKNMKWCLIIIFVLLVIAFAAVTFLCGWFPDFDFKTCKLGSSW